MRREGFNACVSVLIALAASSIHPQALVAASDPFTETGRVAVDGRMMPYVIHYLPPSSFPNLPAPIADLLNQRGCVIPQTYEAHRPENVIHGAFERPGSSDWAVLCSAKGRVELLVFFASTPANPAVLVAATETDRLQAYDGGAALGFDWGIDPASPGRIHDAQTGMERRPPPPDHDAIADSVIDQRTVYRLYLKGKWTLVDLPEP